MMVSPEVLRRFPIFAGQSFYMLDEIAMISEGLIAESEEWIFHEEEEAKNFYLILEGDVALTMYLYYNGSGKHLKTTSSLTQGQFFGWSALLESCEYKMGARAETDCKLIRIDGNQLSQLFDDNPQFGYFFMKNISHEVCECYEYKCIQVLSMLLDSRAGSKEVLKNNSY